MIIKYTGHSCFKVLDGETGYSIVFDPYKPGSVPGYHEIRDVASMVLSSHGHDDHCGFDSIIIEPKDESPYRVETIDAYHDPEKGKARGENRVHIVTHIPSGEKIVHYGDIGEDPAEFLTEENLALLKDADIALVPIGGFYTIDMHQALDLIERTTPKLVIPMHFRSGIAGFGYPNIDTIEDFLDLAQKSGKKLSVARVSYINTGDIDLGCDILVLKPHNI